MRTVLALFVTLVALAVQARTNGPINHSGLNYPGSCLAWPLFNDEPTGQTPTYTGTTMLERVDLATMQPQGFESVTFTFWRVACNAGRSALLMRIARSGGAILHTDAVKWPAMNGIAVTQGSFNGTVRLAQVPNAPEASLPPGALIPAAVSVALENFYRTDGFTGGAILAGATQSDLAPFVNFDNALQITLPNPSGSGIAMTVSVPGYDPTLYPAASMALPITGYNAGSYFDPSHPGEGMFIGVTTDQSGTTFELQLRRSITISWFTYDQVGRAFWLYGNLQFDPGAREVTVPMRYYTNGGFAGAATATGNPWGNLKVSFPDCSAMRFTYAANAGLPAPIPSGSGDRTWARLTQENGLDCI
jgi:hypothetical protein